MNIAFMAKITFNPNYEVNLVFKNIPINKTEMQGIKDIVSQRIGETIQKYLFIELTDVEYGFGLVDPETKTLKAGLI